MTLSHAGAYNIKNRMDSLPTLYSDIWLFGIDSTKDDAAELVYNRCFGGEGDDRPYSLCMSKTGTMWLVGKTNAYSGNGNVPLKHDEMIEDKNSDDAWVFEINPKENDLSKQITYNKCFGCVNQEESNGIVISPDYNLLWTIGTSNSNYDENKYKAGTSDIPQSKKQSTTLNRDFWLLSININTGK